MNAGFGISDNLAVIVTREGKLSKECKGCKYFYGEKYFKPIYNDETLLANGKNPAYFKTGKYCEYCQDRISKSGVWNL